MVGLGFDRDMLEAAGIKEAEAFVAVSSGDNSNIVSARVALEHYHVPKVIARIYDPRRAEIYERLNIPTVATTTWGVKQIKLMLFHDRQEVRETIGGGDLVRLRVPVPPHLVGKKVLRLNIDGKILVAGVSRGGGGFIPTAEARSRGRLPRGHHGEGRHGPARRDQLPRPGSTTDAGRRYGCGSGRPAPRLRPRQPRSHGDADRAGPRGRREGRRSGRRTSRSCSATRASPGCSRRPS